MNRLAGPVFLLILALTFGLAVSARSDGGPSARPATVNSPQDARMNEASDQPAATAEAGDQAFLRALIDVSTTLAVPEPVDPQSSEDSGFTDLTIDVGEVGQLIDLTELSFTFTHDPWQKQVDRVIDIDGDGRPELHIERQAFRGPLSTYGTIWSAAAQPHCTMLRAGQPVASGEWIDVGDVKQSTATAMLFSAAGSLRFPERPMTDFSGGPWYGQRAKALVLLMRSGDRLGIGRVIMSVTVRGELIVHETDVMWLDGFIIEFEVDPAEIPPLDPVETEQINQDLNVLDLTKLWIDVIDDAVDDSATR